MPTADAAATLAERGSCNRNSKSLSATIDKPWLRKLWQPRDQASVRDTSPPPPAGRLPHPAAQRPKAQPQQAPAGRRRWCRVAHAGLVARLPQLA